MIEIRNLQFSYGKGQPLVLDGIDLDIPDGQWLAVIGPNGSGKSTLARCLNGLLQPAAGSVAVDGLSTGDEAALQTVREHVSFVFQNPDNQIVATSVEDDVAFGPENLGLSREEISRRVDGALHVTKLTALREKAPHLLSGGEKQRVAIAGALAMASRYLVLDEPTSMLDPLMREQVVASLRLLHRSHGLGVIYVTNIMEEALLAERVIVLEAGRVIKDGSPAEIFREAEWLLEHGLDMPQACRLAAMLADDGYESLRGALTAEELMERLCELS